MVDEKFYNVKKKQDLLKKASEQICSFLEDFPH